MVSCTEEQGEKPEHQTPQLAPNWRQRLECGGCLHKKKGAENLRTIAVCVQETKTELGEMTLKVLLKHELICHFLCFVRVQYLN